MQKLLADLMVPLPAFPPASFWYPCTWLFQMALLLLRVLGLVCTFVVLGFIFLSFLRVPKFCYDFSLDWSAVCTVLACSPADGAGPRWALVNCRSMEKAACVGNL